MGKRFFAVSAIAVLALSLAVFGCKGKTEKMAEEQTFETVEAITPTGDTMLITETTVVEPAQTVATETIPPTAAVPQAAEKPLAVVTQVAQDRNKEIQTALKNAGFYTGAIDGKVGPRTKKAILDFQRANALKVDGKVGPKTWAALEKYLIQQ